MLKTFTKSLPLHTINSLTACLSIAFRALSNVESVPIMILLIFSFLFIITFFSWNLPAFIALFRFLSYRITDVDAGRLDIRNDDRTSTYNYVLCYSYGLCQNTSTTNKTTIVYHYTSI